MINLDGLKLTLLLLVVALALVGVFLLMASTLPLWAGIAVIVTAGGCLLYQAILADLEDL